MYQYYIKNHDGSVSELVADYHVHHESQDRVTICLDLKTGETTIGVFIGIQGWWREKIKSEQNPTDGVAGTKCDDAQIGTMVLCWVPHSASDYVITKSYRLNAAEARGIRNSVRETEKYTDR